MKDARGREGARPVNPRQIEAFRSVMVTGSMTAASGVMCISQPAVSRLVRDLEADLGLLLFQRKGNLVTPTEDAMIIFREVERFFFGSDQVRETAAAILNSREQRLRVAAMPSLVQGFIPRVLKDFLSRDPEIDVFLHSDTSVAIADLVAKRQYDVGFAYVAADHPLLDIHPLPDTEAVSILHRDMPLAAAEEIHASDLDRIPVIVLGPSSLLHMEILSELRSACPGFQPRVQVRYPWSACTMVAEGMGAAIIDPFTAHEIVDERIVCRPFRPRIKFTFSTLFPSTGVLTGPARAFVDLFRQAMEREFG